MKDGFLFHQASKIDTALSEYFGNAKEYENQGNRIHWLFSW